MIERVQVEGYVTASGLARDLTVDSSTIRRDLAQLERAGLIRRTRGGFLPVEPGEQVDVPYELRKGEKMAVKTALGRAAAALVSPGQAVIIDSGSTMYQVAMALRSKGNVTIITNDLLVGVKLAGVPSVHLHLTGGMLLDTVYTLVGPDSVASLAGRHVDWAFIGAEAVHAEAGVTNINVIEIPTKRAMIAAAEKTVVVVDSSKLGRRSLAKVCDISEVSMILTDNAGDPDVLAQFGPMVRSIPAVSGSGKA